MSIPSDRVEIKLKILGLRTERVWVRRTLGQEELVAAIVAKFRDELLLEAADQYALFRSGETKPNTMPLVQLQGRMLYLWERKPIPADKQRPTRRLVLMDLHGTRYPVCWVPGVIGRENKDPTRPQVVPLSGQSRYPQMSDTTSRSYLIVEQQDAGSLTIRIDGDPDEKPARLRKKQPGTGLSSPGGDAGAALASIPMRNSAYPLDDGDQIELVNGAITLTARIIEPL